MIKKFFLLLILLLSFFLTPKSVFAATTYDMATTTNWNIRIDGSSTSDQIGYMSVDSGDFDNDGLPDMVFGTSSGRGYVYILFSSLWKNLTSTGNTLDLSDATKYSIRYSIPRISISTSTIKVTDLNNDGKPDLVIGNYQDNSKGAYTGSVYIILNNLIASYGGTNNNNVDLSTSSNFNIRFDGAAASQYFGASLAAADLNNNGINDLIVGALAAGYNSRAASGSVYIFYDSVLGSYGGVGNIVDLSSDPANYSVRIDGATAGDQLSNSLIIPADLNSDNKQDLVINALNASYSRSKSGSIFLVPNSSISSLTGPGSIIDLATNSNYALRIDGAEVNHKIGTNLALATGNIENSNKADLILGTRYATYGGSGSGSIYILFNSLLSQKMGVGNSIDLSTVTNFSVRYDGYVGDDLSAYSLKAGDINFDSFDDLVVGAQQADNNSRSNSGSTYLILSSKIRSYSGTGNIFGLSNSDNFNVRYDGPLAVGWQGGAYLSINDFNNDGSKDLFFGGDQISYNSRTDAGSLYLIYNFPHTISLNIKKKDLITGTVSAPNSVTSISGVQYNYSNDPAGTWYDCTGATTFTCNPTNTTNKVYIRAYDTNGSYTASASYAVAVFNDGVDSSVSSDPNCPKNFKYCLNQTNPYTFYTKSTHHDDLYITINEIKPENIKILPWSQGFNTLSQIYEVKILSAFNGYPITKTDNPFTLILPTKQKGNLAWFNPNTQKWKSLTNPVVFDGTTTASTTNLSGLFVVTYLQQQNTPVLAAETKKEEVIPQPELPSISSPKPKSCFLWWCW